MKDTETFVSHNADGTLHEGRPAPHCGGSLDEQRDRHQMRIDEYKSQALELADPLFASMGGLTADMLTFAKQFGDGIREALAADGCTVEVLQELAPVFNTFQSLTRQIGRNTAFVQRAEEARQAEMLQLTLKKSHSLGTVEVRRRKLNAHRDAWQEEN